jgi:membrane fusion protein (multidrug efflux system)
MADFPESEEKVTAPPPPALRGEPGRRRFPWRRLLLLVLVLAIAAGGGAYWYLTKDEESTDDAFTDGRAVMIAPQVAGNVVTLAIDDNQFVHRGDLLVEIDPRPYRAARDQAAGQLKLAEAQLEAAKLQLSIAEVTYPARKQSAEAALYAARAQEAKAEADLRRQRALPPGATTRELVDQATAAAAQAEAAVRQAEAQLAEADLVQQNIDAARAQVKQLEGQVAAARAALEQAEINLGFTRVVAPQDGFVTKRNVELGNYVQPGQQILSLVAPEVWVTANFKETQLDRMRPGQKVRIHVDAYPHLQLIGHVDSIQKGSGSKFTAFPPENATGNFVKIVQRVPVKIVIDQGLDPKLPLPLGISVEPTVDLTSTPAEAAAR